MNEDLNINLWALQQEPNAQNNVLVLNAVQLRDGLCKLSEGKTL